METTSMLIDTGSRRSPVSKALRPCTIWRYRGMMKNRPSKIRF